MVGDQLQVDVRQDGRRTRVGLGEFEHVVGVAADVALAVGDGHDRRVAGLDFLDVAHSLAGALVVAGHDGEALMHTAVKLL